MRAAFEEIRARLSLRELAEREGFKVKAWGRGIHFDCPVCRKGGRDGSGARARDGVTWRCVRCMEGGDVVDLLRLSRGLDAKGAFREACELAGLGSGGGAPVMWRGLEGGEAKRAEPNEEPSTVGADDLAERHRAVRCSWGLYASLADLGPEDSEDVEWVDARSAIDILAERDREGFGATAVRSPDGYLERLDLETARRVARDYFMRRLGAAWQDVRGIARELVGLCPAADSGLAVWLRYLGGEALIEAARRAGLLRADGRELFAGCLVYAWRDEAGRVVYLTGRKVPGLHLDLIRDPEAKDNKLCPKAPHNNDVGVGLPLPEVPFGAFLADKLDGPIFIVEGELDAVHGLLGGPTVATGGTGRMGGPRGVEALKRWLRGREAVVLFDDEADPVKRSAIDERAMGLARAVGCRWAQARDGRRSVEEVRV